MVLALKDTADFPIPTKNIVDNDGNFNYSTANSINAYDRTYLDIINANRTKFFPYDKVVVERSTDSGSTWTTLSTSDFSNENRGKLMSDVGTNLYIGVGNAALTQQLRVTLQFPGTAYYCSLDRAFFRFSNSGHACSVTIEASTYGAQSTYTALASNQTVAGWSGNNMVKFSERSAWGTNNSNHLYNVRFTFKYTSINSSYPTNQGSIQKIDMFGQNFWGTSNTPQHYGHLYSWDYLKNVTFPANVTASAFLGNATSATYLLGNGRIASADISHIYTGSKAHQRFDIVSSTLTTGRPAGDGYLTTYMWDNAGTYDAQFYMPNGSTTNGGRPQVRYRPDGGSWSAWESLAKLSDVPTVNNATLTIQKNGTTVDTFTANASSNVTANITVPESFSDLTGTVSDSQLDWSSILDKIYPVGSVYISVNNVSPQTFIGGTWVAFATGRTLVGVDTGQTEFDTVEETGGEKSHTLTEPELPNINGHLPHIYGGEHKISGVFSLGYGSTSSSTGSNANSNNAYYNMNFGQGQAHNNLQPYITVYMWKRTA